MQSRGHNVHLDKHRHLDVPFLSDDTKKPKIVLAGNPNVGKSLIFNALSDMRVDVSNYPGTTVEVIKGSYLQAAIFDTPGIYSVSSFNDEERVARDIILDADVVLNVVDAKHLERDLFVTQQLIDMGKKIVVLLNFMDEVKRYNIEIDIPKLEHYLGIEVVPIVAVDRTGFENIHAAIRRAADGIQREELHSHLHVMLSMVGSQAEALLVLEGDATIAERHGVEPGGKRDEIYIGRRNRVNYILDQVVCDVSSKRRISDTIGRWAIQPVGGVLFLLASLYITYLFVGKLVAQDLVAFTEDYLGKEIVEPWMQGVLLSVVAGPSWLHELLAGEFGVITKTTTYLFFLLLPLVAAFYLVLAFLEDSGYLPRLATMVDRTLSHFGLNGRAVIPLILGFGCITSATITTRLLNTEREKIIATTILQFAIPCSAQLAAIAALLAGAGLEAMFVYTVVILAVLVAVGTILNKVLHGEVTPLLLDLPPMRLPRLKNVFYKTSLRTYHFMTEATLWFFIGAVAVSVAHMTGFLVVLQTILRPLTTHLLQLPPEASTAFIMGIVRRDFGAAGLYQLTLSPMQVTVALITITLFVPCIASLMVMMKERGLRIGFLIWLGTWFAAFAVGGLVSQIVIH